jgi:regulator of protease activity HflC (stomatin/prohibitin superfamily)
MSTVTTVLIIVVLARVVLALAVRIVKQYERGVLFRLGRVIGSREPGLRSCTTGADQPIRVPVRAGRGFARRFGVSVRGGSRVAIDARGTRQGRGRRW